MVGPTHQHSRSHITGSPSDKRLERRLYTVGDKREGKGERGRYQESKALQDLQAVRPSASARRRSPADQAESKAQVCGVWTRQGRPGQGDGAPSGAMEQVGACAVTIHLGLSECRGSASPGSWRCLRRRLGPPETAEPQVVEGFGRFEGAGSVLVGCSERNGELGCVDRGGEAERTWGGHLPAE